MKRLGLTAKQHELLTFIMRFCDEKGFSPSYQEMADALGYANRSAVFRLTKHLENRGYIRMTEGSARSIIVLVDPSEPADTVPLLKKRIRELTDQVTSLQAQLNAARAA